MSTYKRLDLSNEEMKELVYFVKRSIEQGESISTSLQDKINNAKDIKKSINKKVAIMGATEKRVKKAVKSIKQAIEYIEQENKKMTYTAIAKYAEVSKITVKKYVPSIENNKAITSKDYYYLSLK